MKTRLFSAISPLFLATAVQAADGAVAPPIKVKVRCEMAAKAAAKQAINDDTGSASGLVDDIPVRFLPLNNGGIFVIAAWVERVFDWEVVVTVNRNCEIKNTFVNEL